MLHKAIKQIRINIPTIDIMVKVHRGKVDKANCIMHAYSTTFNVHNVPCRPTVYTRFFEYFMGSVSLRWQPPLCRHLSFEYVQTVCYLYAAKLGLNDSVVHTST